NGLQFDRRAIEQLNSMLSDARAQGLSPVVCSAYRSLEYQQKLFDNQVNKQMSKGLSREQADIEARKVVAYPGTSEHNLGLAVDIVSLSYQHLDEAQANTAEVKWLIEHCSEYGFILRYPKDKIDITGVFYEPWHFRYVGIDAAKAITENGQCLEEYLEIMRQPKEIRV
ncbi:MAG: M15 family metallopeptidase, partial [Firmicutes bacterium]|nr:M15 family metallopeptidase [Bacillota bacterium]